MDTFLSIHQDDIVGTLSMFDRMILRGYLTGFFPKGAFWAYLSRQGVLLKDFCGYVQGCTQELKAHIERIAQEAGRSLQYLPSAKDPDKEDRARAIATRDGITEGWVCIFSTLEICMSFDVQGNRETHKLEVVRRQRKCLHYYLYYQDAEFGLMHIRLQSWVPFDMQVYVNGREWLARQLDACGITYQRYDNKLTGITDLKTAQSLCDRFTQRKWVRVLNAFVRRINPHLGIVHQAGWGGYYWTLAQIEYATDVFFRDRATLETFLPSLMDISMTAFRVEDVLCFLGRTLHGNFQGQATTDRKKRPQGRRVKHRMKGNSIKWYDAVNILRIVDTSQGRKRRWQPMGKGIANLWRYAQVGRQASCRYLNALVHAQPTGKAIAELESLCHPKIKQGKRYARLNPVTQADCDLFAAVLSGEHILIGFRNKDLQTHLYPAKSQSTQQQRQHSAHVTCLIAKLCTVAYIAPPHAVLV